MLVIYFHLGSSNFEKYYPHALFGAWLDLTQYPPENHSRDDQLDQNRNAVILMIVHDNKSKDQEHYTGDIKWI